MRLKHYSLRTETTYREWIKRFILFHGKRHPREMGSEEISRFLSDLAVRGKVAASTQNQAFNALLFLYREVLHQEMGQVENVERAKRPSRLPVVLSKGEVERVLAGMTGTFQLMAKLLYGTGMRLMECVRFSHGKLEPRPPGLEPGRKPPIESEFRGRVKPEWPWTMLLSNAAR
jgi:site-specific recombinase XerD